MASIRPFAVPVVCAAAILAGSSATAARKAPVPLWKEATVSESQATAAALAKVPHGLIKSSELERERGRLIWSFDISTPSSNSITEVHIDAKTGKVVAMHRETPAKEKREALADKTQK